MSLTWNLCFPAFRVTTIIWWGFQQGNTMYAEMLANLISKQGSLLEVGKVYNIKCFRVVHAKSSYKVTSAPFMIYFTLYSIN
jgi:hypothetical protein